MDAVTRLHHRRIGAIGTLSGGSLAGFIVLAAYGAASIPAVESALNIRYLLGPDGLTFGNPYMIGAAWLAGPAAAAVAGWLAAVRRAAGDRSSGVWMGVLTFYLALAIAISADYLIVSVGEPVSWGAIPSGIVVFSMMGTFILAPLLALCAMAGVVWGVVVARIVRVMNIPTPMGPTRAIPWRWCS
jgi:hypothetical protein